MDIYWQKDKQYTIHQFDEIRLKQNHAFLANQILESSRQLE